MNILLAMLAATVMTAPKGKIYNDAPVVTNVTFEGLATEDAALLAVYYPEGNVTNVSQITTEGVKYGTTIDGRFCVSGYTGSATDVVVPWKDDKGRTLYAIWGGSFVRKSIASLVAPKNVTLVGQDAFYACLSLESVSLPGVTTINKNAFYNCSALKNLSIPKVEIIGDQAIIGCDSLENISLPAVTNIGELAFFDAPILESVYLPKVEYIGKQAFAICPKLKTVDFGTAPRDTIPTLGSGVFSGVPTSCRFIIPLGMYDEWIAADGWKDLYAAGYKFVGYADAAKVVPAPAITNIARSVVNSVWDDALGVAWEARMHDGALYYIAVTNRQEVAE